MSDYIFIHDTCPANQLINLIQLSFIKQDWLLRNAYIRPIKTSLSMFKQWIRLRQRLYKIIAEIASKHGIQGLLSQTRGV